VHERLAGLLAHQADACARLGSPMYAALLHRVAGAMANEGPVRRVLAPHLDAPGPAATGLRLLGAVHRLVLERRAGELVAYYPSIGGRFDIDLAWPAFLAVLDERSAEVAEQMRRPPQTNEVGRAAALTGGLLRLVGGYGRIGPLPVRLHELGASAGLNLRADRFRYVGTGGAWGSPGSPVLLEPAWRGVATPVDARLDIAERVGCDPNPIDPTSTEGRLVLTSYVWPDQAERLQRLRGAFAAAAEVPVVMRAQHAAELVAGLELADDKLTVVWHSVMWQYLDAGEQAAVRADLDRLGAAATATAPFAHLLLEPRLRDGRADHEFLVVARAWPGGSERVLGSAPGHGVPVEWEV